MFVKFLLHKLSIGDYARSISCNPCHEQYIAITETLLKDPSLIKNNARNEELTIRQTTHYEI